MTHYAKLERMYLGAPISREFDPDISIEEGRAEVTLPVRERHFHPAHAAHGAVLFKALDDAAFFAANSLVEDVFVLTTNFTLHFTRPVSEGHVHAEGEVVNDNPRQLIADAVAYDDEGNQIARGTGTFATSSIELTPEVGYE